MTILSSHSLNAIISYVSSTGREMGTTMFFFLSKKILNFAIEYTPDPHLK